MHRSRSHCVRESACFSLLLSVATEVPSWAFISLMNSPGVAMLATLRSCRNWFSSSQISRLWSWFARCREVFSLLLSMNFWYHCRRSCSVLCWSCSVRWRCSWESRSWSSSTAVRQRSSRVSCSTSFWCCRSRSSSASMRRFSPSSRRDASVEDARRPWKSRSRSLAWASKELCWLVSCLTWASKAVFWLVSCRTCSWSSSEDLSSSADRCRCCSFRWLTCSSCCVICSTQESFRSVLVLCSISSLSVVMRAQSYSWRDLMSSRFVFSCSSFSFKTRCSACPIAS
mmetsp:Transcript_73043/g.165668  ORF Transcript_73043/g.165668 Transcript_73043/m.165668 type:complete len:285 (-) Transcript_73043:454-1308(-)